MKILAFEVRADERPYFKQLEEQLHLNLTVTDEVLTPENLHLTKGFDGITTLGRSYLDRPMLDALKENKVRYLSTRTIGYNHIDVDYAKEIGLRVSNAAYAPNGVADYTIMLMLMCLRNYKQALYRANANDYSLPGLEGREMRNLTVGVVGTGKIGRTVISNLQGFGCRILAYDPYPAEDTAKLCRYVSLEELYHESDIITMHIPLNPSTYHLISEDSLKLMKDGVVLINTARGELMEIEALLAGIESKKIGALGLDVIENEEGIYHKDRRTDIISNRDMAYLRQFPNVTMTQHIAFYTIEAVESMVRCGIHNLLDMEAGSCDLEL